MIFTYNKIVKSKNQIDFALKNIDVQLKKRFEALPNLVAVLKKYMSHEKGIFEKIAELRAAIENSKNRNEKLEAEQALSHLLGGINLTVENYPELKTNESVIHLQRSINEYAEQISASQRAYNGAVLSYNDSITVFPNNIVAKLFGFSKEEYISVISNEEERRNPDLNAIL
ncbi:LemA family protein [Zobellia uliginosa]|uniref:LemA family protein n=1 Tax=Zobellia uliginosa TaxID=143224 RepID=UPI0026E1D5F0|nr:LemA family protein [Zobellia uliginosa]MDO6517770.1 LemA family protein [Zobellia uliginosa]